MSIRIEDAPAWVKKLEGEMRKAALRGLQSAGHRVVEHIQTEVIPSEPRKPVDRGIYRAGWRSRATEDGAEVYNNTPHAGFIEDGVKAGNVKPGRAMIDALAAWVLRKGLVGRGTKKEERATEARRIAFAISRSMKSKGIFDEGGGLHILAKGLKRAKHFIEEEVKAEIEKLRG